MRTQTVIESVTIVIDDYCNFSKFSKEDFISNLIKETGDEATMNQLVATPSNIGFGPSEFVATADKPEIGTVKPVATDGDLEVNSRKSKCVSIDILTDPLRKELSSRVKKNHPSDLIIGDPNKGIVIRKRYVNHVKYVYVFPCVN